MNRIEALVKLYDNLSQLRAKIHEELTGSTENLDDKVFDDLDALGDGEMTAEEFLEENADEFKHINELENSEYIVPAIDIDLGSLYATVSQKVDGGTLVAGVCESDKGTYQNYITYHNEENAEVNLALAEVKRGDLAECDGKPADNKDIDLYIWSDPREEDYQQRYTFSYEDLSKTFANKN